MAEGKGEAWVRWKVKKSGKKKEIEPRFRLMPLITFGLSLSWTSPCIRGTMEDTKE